MNNITVIILTFNEEIHIERCIKSALQISDKIFVVDSYSNDKTIEILKTYHSIKTTQHRFEDYSKQRNWSQKNCPFETEWVLHLDAGEWLTNEFIKWVHNIFPIESQKYAGFIFSRRVYFLDKWIKYGGMYPNYHLRLFKKVNGFCENKAYDQHFIVNGRIKKLPLGADMIDDNGTDIVDFIIKHTRWAEKEANEIVFETTIKGDVSEKFTGNSIEQKRFLKNGVYYKFPIFLRSFLFFVYRYFFRLGFLDGKIGFIYHFFQCLWFRTTVDALIVKKKILKKDVYKNR